MGLSLQYASRPSGVSRMHIRDIENGRGIPSFEMSMKFLKANMVDAGKFLKQTGYPPSNKEPVRGLKRIPILSWTQAANWQQIGHASQHGDYGGYVETETKRVISVKTSMKIQPLYWCAILV